MLHTNLGHLLNTHHILHLYQTKIPTLQQLHLTIQLPKINLRPTLHKLGQHPTLSKVYHLAMVIQDTLLKVQQQGTLPKQLELTIIHRHKLQ
jgi:hypothetical protein